MPGLRPGLDTSAGNAESQAESTADGVNTHGVVNRHPAIGASSDAGPTLPFRVGVAEDRNKRWRRTMEDAHAFIYDFGGVHGQGYFSIFDGHAGKHAAEWCGQHFHEQLMHSLATEGPKAVPDVLNITFHEVDAKLGQLASTQNTSSGCTAVTCLLRLEDEQGRPVAHASTGGVNPKLVGTSISKGGASTQSGQAESQAQSGGDASQASSSSSTSPTPSSSTGGGLFSSFAKRIRKASSERELVEEVGNQGSKAPSQSNASAASGTGIETQHCDEDLVRVGGDNVKRVLYTANVGDARAVLCRKGRGIRLTYDHKASDAQEVKRITDAGGFVMNNRVNAVLAVTRSLGDSAMKEFVVGAPYTTETQLTDDDSFLIVACDGLWDVADDQDAVDLIAKVEDPQEAAHMLLQFALSNFSTDNTSVMVVKFNADGSSQMSRAAAAKSAKAKVQQANEESNDSASSSSAAAVAAATADPGTADIGSFSSGGSSGTASRSSSNASTSGRLVGSGGGGSSGIGTSSGSNSAGLSGSAVGDDSAGPGSGSGTGGGLRQKLGDAASAIGSAVSTTDGTTSNASRSSDGAQAKAGPLSTGTADSQAAAAAATTSTAASTQQQQQQQQPQTPQPGGGGSSSRSSRSGATAALTVRMYPLRPPKIWAACHPTTRRTHPSSSSRPPRRKDSHDS